MRPDSDKPYYTAYEKRYRSVYAQGVKYWSNFPSEIADAKRIVDDFLDFIQPTYHEKVIEFGCGEGFLAGHIAEKGFSYTGIDIAESAIKKARNRWLHLNGKASFILDDITKLPMDVCSQYDIGIDISCLHMLVLDKDRRNYLQNAYNIIADNGYMLFGRQLYSKHAIAMEIQSYEEWLYHSGQKVDELEMREAVESGQNVNISIPMIAARPCSADLYRKELENQNFRYIKTIAKRKGRFSFIVRKE